MLGTDFPIVAVMTGSMAHDNTASYSHYRFLAVNYGYSIGQIDSWPMRSGFNAGDVVVIKGIDESQLQLGDVIVFEFDGEPTPIIHRIVYIKDGYYYTKGDHNSAIDPDCRLLDEPAKNCWRRNSIKGKAVLRIPYLGMPKLLLQNLIDILK